jgi:hypothetical protein
MYHYNKRIAFILQLFRYAVSGISPGLKRFDLKHGD